MGQREALANVFILYTPFAVGLILATFAVNAWGNPLGFAWFTLGLYVAGLALFLLAKAPSSVVASASLSARRRCRLGIGVPTA